MQITTNKIKKQIYLIVSLFFIVSASTLHSQGESWNWYFGANAGVNFPGGSGSPVALTNGQLNTNEGVATISDAAGNLLFYTDGISVYNRLHIIMPNGFGLLGDPSSTQSGVIVPKPGSPNIYYIFTCAVFGNGYYYSEVDMTLSAGNGDVTANKNILVNMNNTEKCCAVKHCNGIDYWIITHEGNNNTFKTYLVTAAGINLVPIVSNIGSNHPAPGIGYLKASQDGKKLAYAIYGQGMGIPAQCLFEILDFNNSTGVLSNPITITGVQYFDLYGVEFSPDNTKVYIASASFVANSNLFQFNLCAGTNAAIIASATNILSSTTPFGALQLGPDGKIYVANFGTQWLGVINNPNVLGIGCNFVNNAVSLNGGICQGGLPNFISSSFQPILALTSTVSCLNGSFTSPTLNTSSCGAAANAITAYSWDFGDPGSGVLNTSTVANPNHAYTSSGTYTVNLVLTIPCGTIGVTHTLTTISCGPAVAVNNVTLCSGSCAVLTATASGGTGPYTYNWTPNIGTGPGPHTVCPNSTTQYSVSITDALNVTASNTSTVVVITTPTLLVTPSSPTLCANNFNGSTNTVSINVSGATTYTWTGISGITSNTTAGAVISATAIPGSALGSGSVTGYNGTCSTTATFSVTNIPNPTITVPSAVLCGPTATLTANGATNYSWSPVASLSSSTGSSVIANPVNTTVYSIIGTSLNCNSATQTATVTVPVSLSVSIASSTNQVCSGGTINFMATASGGIGAPYTYSWSNGATGSVIPISENAGGIYSYNVIIRDASACASASATALQTITVIPSPVLTAANAGICQGQSANLVVNGASSYSWSPSTALSSTLGSAVIANPSSTTVYSITGRNLFCASVATLTVSVVPYPNSNVTSPNQQICYGSSTQINATNAQGYNWTPNYAISNITGPNVVVSPSVNTTYTITSFNSNGTLVCSETKMMPIVVVPQVTPTIINNQSICIGNKVTLQAGGGNTYNWTPSNSLNNAGSSGVVASPSVTTIYTVDVSSNGSCGKTATVLVKVNPKPQVFAGRDTTFNLDEPMFINASGSGTLTWVSGEGIFCRDCPETKINATQTGCYVIETVNEFGCKASDEVCIEVTTNSGIFIPNSFTPNDDGLNDVFLVQGYSLSEVKLEIFDRWGEKLFSSNDQKLGWNGTYKGTVCKNDVYVYDLSYKGLDGKRQFKTGHVTVNR